MEQFFTELRLILDLLLAAFLGAMIGLERKYRAKEAGVGTHTMVCLGAALMMVISINAFSGADTSRVAAQIVSGVGFLGAGIIIYRKYSLQGLTTAAGIWATAGVGMACAGRLYYVAVGTAALMIGLQLLFHANLRIFKNRRHYTIMINFINTEDERNTVKELFSVKRFNKLVIERKDGLMYYSAVLHTHAEYSSTLLTEIMHNNPFILSVERYDEA